MGVDKIRDAAHRLHNLFLKSSALVVFDSFQQKRIIFVGLKKGGGRRGPLARWGVEIDRHPLSDDYRDTLKELVEVLRGLGRKLIFIPPEISSPGTPKPKIPAAIRRAFMNHHVDEVGHGK